MMPHFSSRPRSAFTLIELLVVVAIIAVMATASFLFFFNQQPQDDVATAKTQIAATLREAQSRAVSQDQDVAWGVHFANATATAPFYALFSSAYSVSSTVTYYRLPPSVGMILVPSGLVGYWPLDEGSGNSARDYSGNGSNGIWYGTQAGMSGYYSAGVIGKYAGVFNGSNDYVDVGNLGSFPTQGTISFWMTTTGTASYPNPLTTCYACGNAAIRFEQAGNSFYVFDGVHADYYTSALVANTWYHIAFTWNTSLNTEIEYLNGVQVSSSAGNFPATIPNFAIGEGYNTSRYWNGLIDDVRLYDRALSAAEVSELYNESLDVIFSPISGSATAATSIEVYSLSEPAFSSTISIGPSGEISF